MQNSLFSVNTVINATCKSDLIIKNPIPTKNVLFLYQTNTCFWSNVSFFNVVLLKFTFSYKIKPFPYNGLSRLRH